VSSCLAWVRVFFGWKATAHFFHLAVASSLFGVCFGLVCCFGVVFEVGEKTLWKTPVSSRVSFIDSFYVWVFGFEVVVGPVFTLLPTTTTSTFS
jgi:hypothetical protein